MAEDSTPEQRTEMPTDRRMGELRKEGALFMSNEIVQVASLIAGFTVLHSTWSWMFSDMKRLLQRSFRAIASGQELSVKRLHDGFVSLVLSMSPSVIVVVATVAAISSFAVLLQTRFNVKEKKIDFKLHFLNPISGLRRIFSLNGAVNTIKAIVKLAIIIPIGFIALKHFAPEMVKLVHLSIEQVLAYTGNAMSQVFWKVIYVLIGMALFDYGYGKFRWLQQNKMTKEEVKDERKSLEGDETTKRKIIAKGMQRIAQRLRQAVPKADVVITNPTHFAVALQYDRATMRAPKVVAKGKDFMALRIREIAKQSGVPILERKPLARALYASTEVGSEIPYDLFKAVAEVLAYVYRLKGRNVRAQAGR